MALIAGLLSPKTLSFCGHPTRMPEESQPIQMQWAFVEIFFVTRDCATVGLIIYNRPGFPSRKHMTAAPAKPRIAIGSDHAGFSVKEIIRKYLESAGYAVSDLGTSSEESVDYPDFGKAVAERVISKQADLGIAVCGSGIGISIAANKVVGIRAALAHDVNTARLAREHNDANVLALGGRIVTGEAGIEMVQAFLTTAYLGCRHQRRLDKIAQMEEGA